MDGCREKLSDFLKILDYQRDISKMFINHCSLYSYCNDTLYKYNLTNKLWEVSNKYIFIGDYADWMQNTFIRFSKKATKATSSDLIDLGKTIQKKIKKSYAIDIYEYSISLITDNTLEGKFDKSYPLLIPTNNGKCYDLEKRIEIDRLKEHYFTYQFNVSYTTNTSDKINDFISKICCNKSDVIKYLQRILAYCISGHNKGQLMFVFTGCGSNGKSVLLKLLEAIMSKSFCAVDKAIMIKSDKSNNILNSMYALSNKRVGYVAEIKQGEKLNDDSIKSVSGSDKIAVKKLYSNMGDNDTTLFIKMILCTNNLFEFDGTQKSLLRRIRLFTFDAEFLDADKIDSNNKNQFIKNMNLQDELISNCLNEFFSWCCNGYDSTDYSFEKNIPASTLKSQTKYFDNQNSFKGFIESKIKITNDKSDSIDRADIYDKYIKYCDDNAINLILKKSELFIKFYETFGEPTKTNGSYKFKKMIFIDDES